MVPQAQPLQHQEWRKMKPGTVAQLAAGMRSAETVHRHNITGQRVRDALVAQAVSSFTRRSRNAAAGTKGIMSFMNIVANALPLSGRLWPEAAAKCVGGAFGTRT